MMMASLIGHDLSLLTFLLAEDDETLLVIAYVRVIVYQRASTIGKCCRTAGDHLVGTTSGETQKTGCNR